jgi:Ca2+-binding EF-hand superfamily protein
MKPATKITLALLAVAGLAAGAAAAHGWGDRAGRGPGAMLFDRFDADGDGAVTADEARGVAADGLARFDADGDGTLSLEEFAGLHAEITRARMVDAFQRLDADGDGAVTAAEMDRPIARMTARLDRDGDGDVDAEDLRRMRDDRDGRRGWSR